MRAATSTPPLPHGTATGGRAESRTWFNQISGVGVGVAQAAADRHQATVARARHAIEALDRTGQPITFCAVADTADVSRAWLYRHPDIRDLIIRLRTAPSRLAGNPANQRATTESLRQLLDTARHEIAELRADNLNLRDQLARSLGHQRTQP